VSRCEDPTCCDPDRHTTERTQGVWTTCDDCGADWWCVVGSRDWMDEPETFVCSGGCEDGYPEDYFDDDREAAVAEEEEADV